MTAGSPTIYLPYRLPALHPIFRRPIFTLRERVIPYRLLRFLQDRRVATVTLDSGDGANRVDLRLAAELREVFQAIQEDQSTDLVILTASGSAFSAGRELAPAALAGSSGPERLEWLSQLQVASFIALVSVPVIVAINGDALDHGLELALAGDLRIAVSNARFGLTDLARGGFPWDGGTQRLPRLIGLSWARDMILTSRIIDAAQALDLGLVNRVVEPDRLEAETRALAEDILAGGPIAARYAKEAVIKGTDLPLTEGLRLEADLNVILQSTADRTEGIQSFLEKRTPRYTGR